MLKNLYDLNKIKSDNYRDIDVDAVESLANSIKTVGLQEPIRLFEIEETGEQYVISGHHRLEALKRVKRDPDFSHQIFQAFVMSGDKDTYNSQKVAISSVLSNMLRTNLAIVDRAEAFAKLKRTGMSAAEIAKVVGKDKRTIEMTLNVALLPKEIKTYIKENPKLKDSLVYRESVKLKKDPNHDVLSALRDSQDMKGKRAGASASPKPSWCSASVTQKLQETNKFTPEDIELIIEIFSQTANY